MTLAVVQPHPHLPTDWETVRQLAHTLATPGTVTTVPLSEATGRVLAEPLTAVVAVPSFDNAAMDGYAVRGAGPWRVAGRALAGRADVGARLQDGTAIEIATGAPIPSGADRVVPYEQAERIDGRVFTSVDGRSHIRWRGEYVRQGQSLLEAGTMVTAPMVGLAASIGLDEVAAYTRPRVGILITGDEVVHQGPPPWGCVRDSIGPMLAPLLRAWGAEVRYIQPVCDDAGDFTTVVAESVADVDLTVVCGASSVGPADGLHRALDRLRATVHVDGVACKPGHPQVLARIALGWITGLPGNPYAALVAAFTIVEPLLAGLTGRRLTELPPARLTDAVPPDARRTRILPICYEGDGIRLLGEGQPGYLGGAALADAFAVVPPGRMTGQVRLLRLPR